MARLEEMKSKEAEEEAKLIGEYRTLIEKLESDVLQIGAKAGTSGKIFGSVTNVQLAAAIKEKWDLDVERKKIEVPEDVKDLGSYVADVQIYKHMVAKVRFEVVAD